MKISRRDLRRIIAEQLGNDLQRKDIISEGINLRLYMKALNKYIENKGDEKLKSDYEERLEKLKSLESDGKGPWRHKEQTHPRRARAQQLLNAYLEVEAGETPDYIEPSPADTPPEVALDEEGDEEEVIAGETEDATTNPDTPGEGRRYTATDNFPVQRGHRDKSKGHIEAIQRQVGAKPDGYFGKNTEAAVKAYTRDKLEGVEETGVVTAALFEKIKAGPKVERSTSQRPAETSPDTGDTGGDTGGGDTGDADNLETSDTGVPPDEELQDSETNDEDLARLMIASTEGFSGTTLSDLKRMWSEENWSGVIELVKKFGYSTDKVKLARDIVRKDININSAFIGNTQTGTTLGAGLRQLKQDGGGEWDPDGFNSRFEDGRYGDNFLPKLLKLIEKYLDDVNPGDTDGITLNESKTTYGDSYGTLLRKRYRRY